MKTTELLKYIELKKDLLREKRNKLAHDHSIADKLDFKVETQRIITDRNWLLEMMDLLSEVAKKVETLEKKQPE